MKSSKTREELNIAAMLLDMWYDHRDHTFNKLVSNGATGYMLDADTLEKWSSETFMAFHASKRKDQVKSGEIGAADGPFNERLP